ncbi:RHS repeat domain-containing protein [Halosimplex halophilum]|uniref:hypothetical protein n=1 Tax=Halosimplex halophilum TaxID=2559572 RepID=UPI00107F815E|nr:hypothetical protein [Halosimplex halophilum]
MSWDITITDAGGDDHSPPLYAPAGENMPRRIPAANGRPVLEFAVPPNRDSNGDPEWFASAYEDASVHVLKDGVEQPYDRLVGFEDRPSAGVTILRAIGGDELDDSAEASFSNIPTVEAARRVVEDNTSYGFESEVAETTEQDVLVWDKTDGLATTDIEPPADDSPARVVDGDVTSHQTLFLGEPSTTLDAQSKAVELTVELGYAIPAERVGAAVDIDTTGDIVGLELAVDGSVIGEVKPGTTVDTAPTWIRREGADQRLDAGEHTLTVQCIATEDAGGTALTAVAPDAIAVYDAGFDYDFDPDLVTGPETHPAALPVSLREPLVTRAVTGLRIKGYWADNEPGTFDLSNGAESEYATEEVDFDSYGAVADVDVVVTRYGSDSTETPEYGFKANRLTGFRLVADLSTMPLVVDETVDGTVAEVLTELADTLRGDFIWTFDTDDQGNEIVRFVQSGSRQSTQPDIENYSVEKRVDDRLDEVRILGGRVDVEREAVRVAPAILQDVGASFTPDAYLDNGQVVEGSETVTDADSSQTYERGTHYTIDYDAGTLQTVDDPPRADPIPAGAELLVSYQFQPSATVTRDGATAPIRSQTIDELPLRSDRACRLAAEEILDAASSPTYDATAELRGNTTYSPVADLVSARLPVASLETVDIEATPAGASVRLDAREPIDSVFSGFRSRIESVARHSR